MDEMIPTFMAKVSVIGGYPSMEQMSEFNKEFANLKRNSDMDMFLDFRTNHESPIRITKEFIDKDPILAARRVFYALYALDAYQDTEKHILVIQDTIGDFKSFKVSTKNREVQVYHESVLYNIKFPKTTKIMYIQNFNRRILPPWVGISREFRVFTKNYEDYRYFYTKMIEMLEHGTIDCDTNSFQYGSKQVKTLPLYVEGIYREDQFFSNLRSILNDESIPNIKDYNIIVVPDDKGEPTLTFKDTQDKSKIRDKLLGLLSHTPL